jgi:hypothetical protein
MSVADSYEGVDIEGLELRINESLGMTLVRYREAAARKNELRKAKREFQKANADLFAEFQAKSNKRVKDPGLSQRYSLAKLTYDTLCADLVTAVAEKKAALKTHLEFCESKWESADFFLDYCSRSSQKFAAWHAKLTKHSQGCLKKYIQVVLTGSSFVEARSMATANFIKKNIMKILEEMYREWAVDINTARPNSPVTTLPASPRANSVTSPVAPTPVPTLLYPPKPLTLEEALQKVLDAEEAARPALALVERAKGELRTALAFYENTIADMMSKAEQVRALL